MTNWNRGGRILMATFSFINQIAQVLRFRSVAPPPAPSQPIFCIQEAYRDRVPVIRGYWQAVQRILRLLHLWEGLPFQCGVMWDDRMGIRSKPKYWRSILSYMPLNNSPLFGLLGSQSCIEHTTRLQGYRRFPPKQF